MKTLKEITVFQVLLFLFFSFILFAFVDVFVKVNELKKYDVSKIIAAIKQEYPKTTLTFQNIKIEDNNEKISYSENGAREYYYEKTYFYIKNNQLKKESNYLWVLYLFPSLLFLTIFHEDPRTLKVKELHKVSFHTFSWILGSLLIALIIVVTSSDRYAYRKYQSDDYFKNQTSILLHEINLENYKKIK